MGGLCRSAFKVDVGIMGHLSSSVNFLGCDYWKKARFMVLHNKDMEILNCNLIRLARNLQLYCMMVLWVTMNVMN